MIISSSNNKNGVAIVSAGLPCGHEIPPLNIQLMLESSPLKSRILVRRLAVRARRRNASSRQPQALCGPAGSSTGAHGFVHISYRELLGEKRQIKTKKTKNTKK